VQRANPALLVNYGAHRVPDLKSTLYFNGLLPMKGGNFR
jgi:hypothetical protein